MKKMFIFTIIVCSFMSVTGCAPQYQAVAFDNKTIDGIGVSALPDQGVLWKLKIKNDLNTTAMLVWDECTYVSTAGQSQRIVRGKTKLAHSDQNQPKIPIAGHSFYEEYFIAENNVDYVQSRNFWYGNQSNPFFNSAPTNPEGTARVVLAFEIDGKKDYWVEGIKWVRQE